MKSELDLAAFLEADGGDGTLRGSLGQAATSAWGELDDSFERACNADEFFDWFTKSGVYAL